MKKLNPFFVIGTVGIILTAILHIAIALLVGTPSVHRSFLIMYPVFASVLAVGAAHIVQEKKMVKQRVPANNKRN